MASHRCLGEELDSDSEDEIFFGPVTAKERRIAIPLQNRRTEIFVKDGSFLHRQSLLPILRDDEYSDYSVNDSEKELSQAFASLVTVDSADVGENAQVDSLSIEKCDDANEDTSIYSNFEGKPGDKSAATVINLCTRDGAGSVDSSSLISEMHTEVSLPMGRTSESYTEASFGNTFEQETDGCDWRISQTGHVSECLDVGKELSEVSETVSVPECPEVSVAHTEITKTVSSPECLEVGEEFSESQIVNIPECLEVEKDPSEISQTVIVPEFPEVNEELSELCQTVSETVNGPECSEIRQNLSVPECLEVGKELSKISQTISVPECLEVSKELSEISQTVSFPECLEVSEELSEISQTLNGPECLEMSTELSEISQTINAPECLEVSKELSDISQSVSVPECLEVSKEPSETSQTISIPECLEVSKELSEISQTVSFPECLEVSEELSEISQTLNAPECLQVSAELSEISQTINAPECLEVSKELSDISQSVSVPECLEVSKEPSETSQTISVPEYLEVGKELSEISQTISVPDCLEMNKELSEISQTISVPECLEVSTEHSEINQTSSVLVSEFLDVGKEDSEISQALSVPECLDKGKELSEISQLEGISECIEVRREFSESQNVSISDCLNVEKELSESQTISTPECLEVGKELSANNETVIVQETRSKGYNAHGLLEDSLTCPSERQSYGDVFKEAEVIANMIENYSHTSVIERRISANVTDITHKLPEMDRNFSCQSEYQITSNVNQSAIEIADLEGDSLIYTPEDMFTHNVEEERSYFSDSLNNDAIILNALEGIDKRSIKDSDISVELCYSSESQNCYNLSKDSNPESYGIANNGLIASQIPSLDVSSESSACHTNPKLEIQGLHSSGKSLSDCSQFDGKPNQKYDAQDSFPLQGGHLANKDAGLNLSSVSKDNSDFMEVNSDESDTEGHSPCRKFNDTIEEMEMFLKYGPNYGEEVKNTNMKATEFEANPCLSNSLLDNGITGCTENHDESVIAPRKSSVSSVVSNFNPEINSTRNSVLKNEAVHSFDKNSLVTKNVNLDSEPVLQSPSKSLPPPKPYRNVNLFGASPRKASPKTKLNDPNTKFSPRNPSKRDMCLNSMPGTNTTSPIIPKPAFEIRTPVSATGKLFRTHFSSPRHKPSITKTPSVTPKSGIKRLGKAPNTVTGVTRSVSLISSKEKHKQLNEANTLHSIQQKMTPSIVKKPLARSGLPPFPTPGSTKSKRVPLIKKHLRQGGLDIVSPVAQYLRENPPPALVVNVKPRHKLPGSAGKPWDKLDYQESPEKSEQDKERRKHAHRMTPVLPATVYSLAPHIVLDDVENKENKQFRVCQEIPSKMQPVYVVRHKGRVRLPKGSGTEVTKNSSPQRFDESLSYLKRADNSPRHATSLRGSLMEVSLYESHKTHYSNTLK